MAIVGEKGIDVELGHHHGVLKNPRVVKRYKKDDKHKKDPFHYLEVDVHTDGRESVLKTSWPAGLSQNSALGRLLDRMGIGWKIGEQFNHMLLDGQKVDYVVEEDGHFVRVDPESVSLSTLE